MSIRPCTASARSASDPEINAAASFKAVTATVAAIDQAAALRLSLAGASLEAGVWELAFTLFDPITEAIPPSAPAKAARQGARVRERDMEYLHTMVRVGNLDTALDFWCNKLGLVEVRRVENEKGRYTLVFLAAPEDVERSKDTRSPLLELTSNWDEHSYGGGRNFGHLAYRVDDIYGLCKSLMDKGVTINRPPRDGYMAFVRSPDGISIELLQKGSPLPAKEPWASMPNTGSW
jgi:lactoylglutathione lyase